MKHLFLALLAYALATTASASGTTVYYPHEDGVEIEGALPYRMLELALSHADGEWLLEPSPVSAPNQVRMRTILEEGTQLHVAWFGTSPEFEEAFNTVYFPIEGGLLGWRLMLINEDQQPAFSAVNTIEDLAQFTMAQGPGWGDIPILEAAGLTVKTARYENLHRMIVGGRMDGFPRGAGEAFDEFARFGGDLPGLAIEQDLVVVYPFARFFFTAPDQPELAEAILQGLQRAHADGSYQTLFESDAGVQAALSQGNLGDRRIIRIDNPTLSEAARSIDPQYWFNPS